MTKRKVPRPPMPRRSYTRMPVEERLFSHVLIGDGCWLWTGARNAHYGYGQIILPSKKLLMVHRLAWEMFFGAIPDGLQVLHTCDNPPCFRGSHLFLGTQADNMRDMHQKRRHPRNGRSPAYLQATAGLVSERA